MDVTQGQPSTADFRLGFWVVLLLGVFAWAPATYPGYWQGLEGFVPVFNTAQSNLLASIATEPDFWRGMGSETFLLAHPLLLLGFSSTAAVRITFLFALLLGGLGIYVWLRPCLGDRSAGLAGLLYMLAPPVLATIYIRSSLSDALILALLPMALAGVTTYANSRSPTAAAVCVIAVVWMWRTQAGLAALATVLLLLYVWLVERHRLSLLVVATSAAAGAVSLFSVWSVQAAAPVVFAEHLLDLHQLFGVGWQVAPSIPSWQDGYPFQLGFLICALSILSLWRWRIVEGRAVDRHTRRLLAFCFVTALLLILLTLRVSAPLWHWTGGNVLLSYPWQLLLLSAPLLAATAGSLPTLVEELRRLPYWGVLVALVVVSSYPLLTTEFTGVTPPERPLAVFGANNQLVVLNTTLQENENPREAILTITWQSLQPLDFDYNVFLQALTGDDAAPQVVAQLDQQPFNGERPATRWRPGEILTDHYRLDLSNVETVAELRYHFGYYDWRDGKRLPFDGGIDDKMIFYGQ